MRHEHASVLSLKKFVWEHSFTDLHDVPASNSLGVLIASKAPVIADGRRPAG